MKREWQDVPRRVALGSFVAARRAVGLHTVKTVLAGEHLTLEASSALEYSVARTAYGEAETIQEVMDMLSSGGVLYDIGANVGLYTLVAAKRGVHVVAFEPAPANHASLRRNLAHNHLSSVHVIPLALGETRGRARFFTSGTDAASQINSLSGDVVARYGRSRRVIDIDIARLDDTARDLPPPDVIKIDVEGAEGAVLRGAVQILREHGPVLSIELHPGAMDLFGDSQDGILAFLHGLGYVTTVRQKTTRIQVTASPRRSEPPTGGG